MALDAALFTLHFLPRQSSPSIIDLCSSIPTTGAHNPPPTYTLSRAIRSPQYSTALLDGLSLTELASVGALLASDKRKVVKLINPDHDVDLARKSNVLKPQWTLQWQDETFLLTREGFPSSPPGYDVEIVRKPDPPIKVAMYRPESKRSPAFLQIFDYNIDRCEKITDKRGLEQTLVLAIASCLDAEYDERHKGPTENIFLAPPGTQSGNSSSNSPDAQAAPVAIPLEPNEIFLTPLSEPAHAVEHCLGLLKSGSDVADRGMGLDLVIVRAQGEEMARRALTVAERVKVGFYRLPVAAKGRLLDGTVPNELYLYVRPLEAPLSQPAPSAGQPSSSAIPAAPSPPTSSVRPRIKLGQAAEPTPPAARPAPSSSPSPTPSPATQQLAGISVYLSKSKLEEFEAEQALKARQREERQGRELAHRLSQQQQPQSQPHPQHGGAHGPDWLRPPVRHDGGRSPSPGGRTPSPAGSSGAGTDQSVAGESAGTNSDSSRLHRFLNKLHVSPSSTPAGAQASNNGRASPAGR
ncbi:hypothetical protein BDZ90DRAFT_233797 [Jaminaea rosea]|uniref:Uncharacterized protein n=1 Tax=Jaminaea rosea TaxID=1569628 RepID=A0A316UKK7_9BASI|nr:hypothetical protein BDZ90DRAFT_233797 [Jaminaea rosea]PWN25787.1 hypothetical protein BDZ90DRAFT_233797 [Jaminaea rosea]